MHNESLAVSSLRLCTSTCQCSIALCKIATKVRVCDLLMLKEHTIQLVPKPVLTKNSIIIIIIIIRRFVKRRSSGEAEGKGAVHVFKELAAIIRMF